MEIKNHGNIIHYDNPFKIDSPERDYWLGWILSDGCIFSLFRFRYTIKI